MKYFIYPLVFISLMSCSESVHDHLLNGTEQFADTNYTAAAKSFADAVRLSPDNYNAAYNLGVSYYMQKKYPLSIDEFQKSIKQTNLPDLMGNSFYNIANAYFKIATDSASNPLLQYELYTNSVDNYKNAMIKLPADTNAKLNYLFVKRIIDSLNNNESINNYKDLLNKENEIDKQKQELDKQKDSLQQKQNEQKQKEQEQKQK